MTHPHVHYVAFRYGHHSPHSGYSRLAEFGSADGNGEVIRTSKPLPRSIIRERMLWRLAEGTPGYDRTSMAAELQVASRILRERDSIFHFLYGETTYHYTGYLNNFRQNRIVASFHLPPLGIQQAVQIRWHIRQLSAVICLGRNQQKFFAEILPPERIFFVPLGVDAEYFTPPPQFDTRDPDLCLFVGENYRDLPTLRGVIELVAYRRPTTKFVGVMPSRAHALIGCHPNLTLLSDVPEAEFRELYRSAAVMVLPLHDAVANNAVLEAMACGLPLVVTDVGATRDYVSPDSAVLTRLYDSCGMAEEVLNLLDDPCRRQQMSKQAREQALEFSWSQVVTRLQAAYAAIPPPSK